METKGQILIVDNLSGSDDVFSEQLQKQGYKIITLENGSLRNANDINPLKYYYNGHTFNEFVLKHIFEDHQIDVVIYCPSIERSLETDETEFYYSTNVLNTITLLEQMRNYHVNNILFASSLETYGKPFNLPIMECDPQIPISLYGRTKQFAENLLKDYEKAYGIKHIILRFGEICSSNHVMTNKMNGFEYAPMLNSLLKSVLYGSSCIKIKGYDHHTPDGTYIRDYIHIQDVYTAFEKALEYILHTNFSNEFNLGIGKGYSVIEIIKSIENLSGATVIKQYLDKNAEDATVIVCDPEKAKLNLNWKPYFNDIDSIVRDILFKNRIMNENDHETRKVG